MHVFADSKIWLLIPLFGCYTSPCKLDAGINLVLDQYKELLPDKFEYSCYLFAG